VWKEPEHELQKDRANALEACWRVDGDGHPQWDGRHAGVFPTVLQHPTREHADTAARGDSAATGKSTAQYRCATTTSRAARDPTGNAAATAANPSAAADSATTACGPADAAAAVR